jgi:hypothetical protein
MASFCGHDNEPSVSVNDGKFTEQVRDHQLLKEDAV